VFDTLKRVPNTLEFFSQRNPLYAPTWNVGRRQ
jgi:hypothetical protein